MPNINASERIKCLFQNERTLNITCRMNSTATTRKPEEYIQATIGRRGFLSRLSLFVSSSFFFSVVLTTVVLSQSVSIDINGKVFLGSPRIASHPTDFKLCHKSFAWTKLPIGRIRCNLFGNTMLVLCSQSELVVGSVRSRAIRAIVLRSQNAIESDQIDTGYSLSLRLCVQSI